MEASSTRCCNSSGESRASVNVVWSRKGRSRRFEIVVRNQTTGRAAWDIQRSGRETRRLTRSLLRSASDFGTSSPRTIDSTEMKATTRASASSSAPRRSPRPVSQAARGASSVAPPKAPAVAPRTVIPTWTVARKRSGFLRRASAERAPRWPSFASSSNRVRRTERIPISEAEKKPLTRQSTRMTNTSAPKSTGSPVMKWRAPADRARHPRPVRPPTAPVRGGRSPVYGAGERLAEAVESSARKGSSRG